MMKIAAIVGSIRKESFNLRVVETLKERYQGQFELDIITLNDIPMYNPDDELTPPESVITLRKRIKEADGVLIATPEYNSSIPGVLKNTLDWLSRVEMVLVSKPVMIVGGSPGVLGTVRAQMQLRQILNARGIGAHVLPLNEVFIGSLHEKVQDGRLQDENTLKFLDEVIANFIQFVKDTNQR